MTTRPPLARGPTSPGAIYGCRSERDRTPSDGHSGAGVYSCPRPPLIQLIPNHHQAGSHGRGYGSLDGVPTPTCASPKSHSRYPTPPHTTSPPHSNASTPDSSDENMPHSAADPLPGGSDMHSYFPQLAAPRASPSQVPIVSIRGSRSPTENERAQPDIQVSPTAYSLVAHIGSGFNPECITISAKRGNALVIVADRWDMEDCRYEWVWRFDRDADMGSVHANYDSGVLRVTVKRIPGYRLGTF